MSARKLTNCIIVAITVWIRPGVKACLAAGRFFRGWSRTAVPSSPSDSGALL